MNEYAVSDVLSTVLSSSPASPVSELDGSKIEISSYASPEGGRSYNQRLSDNRINAIYDHLTTTTSIPSNLIVKDHSGTDWDGLKALVEQSNMQYRDDVLYILNTIKEETWSKLNPTDPWQTLTDSRNKQLMELKGGIPYNYMSTNFFAQLRRGSVLVIHLEPIEQPTEVEVIAEEPTEEEPAAELEIIEEPQTHIYIAPTTSVTTPLLAIKTNLLFDVATMANVELELPIGNRWSVAGEWIFPWWVTSDNAYALQLLSGQIEGRYWLGDRETKSQLTGWFAGLYAGGGLYDLQWQNNGYQGEFYIAAGLSAGYAHTINKSGSLRMEYSLGVGYLNTEYRYYEGKQDNEYLVWQHDGKYTWIGPTKAKVSLVWIINKRGGKR